MFGTTLAAEVTVDVKGYDMAKDSTRVPTPEIEAGALVEDGGATTEGKGGYMSGQGLDPAGDVVTTDGTDPGSAT